jgi:DNA-binding GntR family transcriptional regulator
MATWRDHAAIVDAIDARDLEEAQMRLARHYEGISKVIANNKTSSNVGGTQ